MAKAASHTSSPDVITKYEVLFAIRTGVTILLQKIPAFDGVKEGDITFKVSADDPKDIIVSANGKSVTLKNMKREHIEAAVSRGFIMFYEMAKDDEVVRSTLCNFKK